MTRQFGGPTRTYVLLPLSSGAFAEIKQALEAAGYQHAFHEGDGELRIDLHGLAAVEKPKEEFTKSALRWCEVCGGEGYIADPPLAQQMEEADKGLRTYKTSKPCPKCKPLPEECR